MEGVDFIYIRAALFQFLLAFGSLVLHGWARAWSAEKLGDPTPRALGRATLNPLAHIDLLGTIIVPLLCLFGFNNLVLGWPKPVVTTPATFRRPLAGEVLSLLAGPALHFLIAAAGVVAGVLLMKAGRPDEIFGPLIQINAGLGLLSLLPIPPLAGGEILRRGVDMSDRTFALLSRLGGLVLLLALNFETVQRALTWGLVTACWPFLQLCRALNPAAVPRLFG